jgi:hypothetical protein
VEEKKGGRAEADLVVKRGQAEASKEDAREKEKL